MAFAESQFNQDIHILTLATFFAFIRLRRGCKVLNVRNNDAFSEARKLVLGKKQWEEKGKTVGMSIKSIGPEGIRMEQTFTSVVNGFGRFPSGTNMGTGEIVIAPDGSFSGNGQGICTSKDGEAVTWKIYLFGKREKGKDKSFGIVKFWTASKKLAWLNGTIHALEGIGDPKTMEVTDTGYEWK
jgi:hypothetical protein